MATPTEQLIRDYLNRLSVAARGQLEPDDRRALVDRTRDFIERRTASATAMEVGSLLSGLGDPSTLVQRERQRLAAAGGQLPEPPTARNPITKALRRDSGKRRSATWHWPLADGRTDLQFMLMNSGGARDAHKNGSNGTASDRSASKGDGAGSDESRPHVPTQPRDRDWFFRALGGRPDPEPGSDGPQATADGAKELSGLGGARQVKPPWRLVNPGYADSTITNGRDDVPGAPAPTTVRPARQLTKPRAAAFPRQLRRTLSATVAWYRRHPLEASAVVLLGLGGAIYPPVWLLGAAVALPSRVWDGRDKWVGLALPLLLTIVAAVLGMTAGGHVSPGHAIHEGWVYAVAGSRVAAVLGASYLCWRSAHGRRPPAVPPWNRPHKVG